MWRFYYDLCGCEIVLFSIAVYIVEVIVGPSKDYMGFHVYKFSQISLGRGATKKPVGILRVKIMSARHLLKMDLFGTSDPYVKLSLTGERLRAKKTSVKMNNLNPDWNENFKLIVKEPESQALQLQLYDWEKVEI